MTSLLEIYHSFPPPLRSMAASLRGFYLRWWRYGADTEELIEQAHERETWSPSQWNYWQQERLSYVLDHAVRHVPYYREHWARRKRNGDRASHAYLENWSVLNKQQLREFPELFLSDQCDSRRMFRDNTSGSTGTPIYTYLSRKTLHKWYALFDARIRYWHGVSRKDRWAIMGGQLVVPFEQQEPPYWVNNLGLNQLYLSTLHLSSKTARDYVEILDNYKPSHMIVYPSSAAALAFAIQDLNLTPPPIKVIFSNAEPLTNLQRTAIQKTFGCPVINTYGMGEYVIGASECAEGGFHLWPEVGYLEVLADHSDEPIEGASGRFVTTGLLNMDMPLIRYDVGDRGRINDEKICSCGRTLPLIESIEGRSNDLILTRDGRQVFWINPVFYGLPLRETQIVQETPGKIVVRYVPSREFTDKHGEIILERLKKRLGEMDIVLEKTSYIPRSANGKFRAVISLLNNRQTN